MKPRLRRLAIVLFLLASPLLNGQSSNIETQPAYKAKIAALEERWLKAIEGADIVTLDKILADDFVRPVPSAGRFISKAQLLDYYKGHKPTAASRHFENLNVTIYGDTAIARGNLVTAGSGTHAPSKNLFTDVFVLREGRWQAVSAQENDVESR
ncbi:MAG: nuclear transport factor 2 family protein [Acidobacteria bacterium]|nr:nuclear transport factor 2 family protein [Acidobacteriota bacterium]